MGLPGPGPKLGWPRKKGWPRKNTFFAKNRMGGGVVQTLLRAWPDGLDEVVQVVFITQ